MGIHPGTFLRPMDASVARISEQMAGRQTALEFDTRWRTFDLGALELRIPLPSVERRATATPADEIVEAGR
jgi:hypothetical protein